MPLPECCVPDRFFWQKPRPHKETLGPISIWFAMSFPKNCAGYHYFRQIQYCSFPLWSAILCHFSPGSVDQSKPGNMHSLVFAILEVLFMSLSPKFPMFTLCSPAVCCLQMGANKKCSVACQIYNSLPSKGAADHKIKPAKCTQFCPTPCTNQCNTATYNIVQHTSWLMQHHMKPGDCLCQLLRNMRTSTWREGLLHKLCCEIHDLHILTLHSDNFCDFDMTLNKIQPRATMCKQQQQFQNEFAHSLKILSRQSTHTHAARLPCPMTWMPFKFKSDGKQRNENNKIDHKNCFDWFYGPPNRRTQKNATHTCFQKWICRSFTSAVG